MKRYTFQGHLELTGPLHIGSGHGGYLADGQTDTDDLVVRDSAGHAYIPGSSLRGAFKADVCRLAPGLGFQSIREDDELNRTIQQRVKEERAKHAPGTFTEEDLQGFLNQPAVLTPGERLFGSVAWASPLRIPDLSPVNNATVTGQVRQGVGIDRDTGAAREGVKYDFEVLPKGTTFAFRMWCDIPDEPASLGHEGLGLVALGLRRLEQGQMDLGGRLARGVGQVQLERLQVYVLDMGGPAFLSALLADDEEAVLGMTQAEGWAKRTLKEEVERARAAAE